MISFSTWVRVLKSVEDGPRPPIVGFENEAIGRIKILLRWLDVRAKFENPLGIGPRSKSRPVYVFQPFGFFFTTHVRASLNFTTLAD
jgi:hypothetical protein